MAESSVERILELAGGRFDAAEVYEESGESVSVDFEDNRLKEITTRQHRGVGLRVIHGGRIGFASTTDLRNPQKLGDMAAASAQFGDEARFQFPGPASGVADTPLFSPDVPGVGVEQMVEMGREGLEMSREANPEYLYGCGVSRSVHKQRVLNTSGLDFRYENTHMSGHAGVQLVSDDGLLHVYEYKSWGEPFDAVTDLAETVLEKVERASTITPGRLEVMPVVFTPKAMGNLLAPLGVAINGKHVHKGSSVLRGRLGEQVLDERLTIVDDPAVPYAPGSCPTDDEGLPTRRRPLFENGVVKRFLADLQTAALLGIEPGGHGFRSYSSRPSPSGTNTVIQPGDTTLQEMIEGMDRGLVVEQTLGSGQSNTLAGEFSVNLDLAFLVDGGKLQGRVKDCMIAGNVYELLKNNIEAIGSEQQWLGSRCAPPIMIGGMKLAAQG